VIKVIEKSQMDKYLETDGVVVYEILVLVENHVRLEIPVSQCGDYYCSMIYILMLSLLCSSFTFD
jgi:hypothetical protein